MRKYTQIIAAFLVAFALSVVMANAMSLTCEEVRALELGYSEAYYGSCIANGGSNFFCTAQYNWDYANVMIDYDACVAYRMIGG